MSCTSFVRFVSRYVTCVEVIVNYMCSITAAVTGSSCQFDLSKKCLQYYVYLALYRDRVGIASLSYLDAQWLLKYTDSSIKKEFIGSAGKKASHLQGKSSD